MALPAFSAIPCRSISLLHFLAVLYFFGRCACHGFLNALVAALVIHRHFHLYGLSVFLYGYGIILHPFQIHLRLLYNACAVLPCKHLLHERFHFFIAQSQLFLQSCQTFFYSPQQILQIAIKRLVCQKRHLIRIAGQTQQKLFQIVGIKQFYRRKPQNLHGFLHFLRSHIHLLSDILYQIFCGLLHFLRRSGIVIRPAVRSGILCDIPVLIPVNRI